MQDLCKQVCTIRIKLLGIFFSFFLVFLLSFNFVSAVTWNRPADTITYIGSVASSNINESGLQKNITTLNRTIATLNSTIAGLGSGGGNSSSDIIVTVNQTGLTFVFSTFWEYLLNIPVWVVDYRPEIRLLNNTVGEATKNISTLNTTFNDNRENPNNSSITIPSTQVTGYSNPSNASIDHGSISGLSDNDHPQYLNPVNASIQITESQVTGLSNALEDTKLWKNESTGNIYYNEGNVGIGTVSTPTDTLEINGTMRAYPTNTKWGRYMQVQTTNFILQDLIFLFKDGDGVNRVYLTGSNNGQGYIGNKLRIGLNAIGSPAYNLEINGTANITGDAVIGGNVGIGTIDPNTTLHVEGNINVSNDLELRGGGITLGGSYKTAWPEAAADAAKNISTLNTTFNDNRENPDNSSIQIGSGQVTGLNDLNDSKMNITGGRIDGNVNISENLIVDGVVGIGINNPDHTLKVRTTNDNNATAIEDLTDGVMIANQYGVSGGKTQLFINPNEATGKDGYSMWSKNNGDNDVDLFFSKVTAGNSLDRLSIKSGGNVGIGTSTPIERLQVLGGSGSQTYAWVGDPNDYVQVGAYNNDPQINFYETGGYVGSFKAASGDFFFINRGGGSSDDIIFRTRSSQDRLILKGSASVQIPANVNLQFLPSAGTYQRIWNNLSVLQIGTLNNPDHIRIRTDSTTFGNTQFDFGGVVTAYQRQAGLDLSGITIYPENNATDVGATATLELGKNKDGWRLKSNATTTYANNADLDFEHEKVNMVSFEHDGDVSFRDGSAKIYYDSTFTDGFVIEDVDSSVGVALKTNSVIGLTVGSILGHTHLFTSEGNAVLSVGEDSANSGVDTSIETVGTILIGNTSTGSNAGSDICIDANNELCRCGSCA